MPWYEVKTPNKTYYTPFLAVKDVYFHIDEILPKTIAKTLNDNVDNECMYLGEGVFEMETEDTKDEEVTLPSGVYRYADQSDMREGLVPYDLREDEFIDLGGYFDLLKNDLEVFLNNKAFYDEIGTIYKLGILLYGAPGNGKTSLIRHIVKTFIPDDAVVIMTDTIPSRDFVDAMRKTLKDRLKVFVFEELTTNIGNHNFLSKMLNFLDGEESLPNKITIATTNYPENLPGNLVDRQSRFDKMHHFDNPDSSARKIYITHLVGREANEQEVKETSGMSLAAIKELVSLMRLHNHTILEAKKSIEDRKRRVKTGNFGKPKSVGFSSSDDDW